MSGACAGLNPRAATMRFGFPCASKERTCLRKTKAFRTRPIAAILSLVTNDPTRKLDKRRPTDKVLVQQALAELERRALPDIPPAPPAPVDLIPQRARAGFFSCVALALFSPLGCGILVATLIWTRYWPPL